MSVTVTFKGAAELRDAIRRNPDVVKTEGQKFFMRALATYKSMINNNPWQIGGSGGGVPVASMNLLKSHYTQFEPFAAYLKVDTGRAPYAIFVHEGTRKMEGRPWLDHAVQVSESKIERLQEDFLDSITGDLAK